MNKPQYIIVHHSVSPKDVPWQTAERSFNNNHKMRFNFKSSLGWYVGYHYVIYGNGELKQYRKDNEEGAHCKEQGMNFKSLGICLSGNFDSETPNPAQTETLRNFLSQKANQYGIPAENIYPHRRFATYKSCYGNKLAEDWARSLIKKGSMMAEIIDDNGTIKIEFGMEGKKLSFGINSQRIFDWIKESGEPIAKKSSTSKQVLVLEDGIIGDLN